VTTFTFEFDAPARLPRYRGEDVETMTAELRIEDGGQAVILEPIINEGDATRGELFVRIQSWSPITADRMPGHEAMRQLLGKRVRVTIETIEP
jgi:hypothetical protein